jgi:hypothetical protein
MLTHDDLLSRFWYEDNTGRLLWKKIDGSKKEEAGTPFAGSSGKVYLRVKILGKNYLVHRIIWMLKTGEPVEYEIDHKDGNGLNNAWDNLRPADRGTNTKNLRKYSNNKSGHTGVYWNKRLQKWTVHIRVDNKSYHGGCFSELESAVEARLKLSEKYSFYVNHGSDRPL